MTDKNKRADCCEIIDDNELRMTGGQLVDADIVIPDEEENLILFTQHHPIKQNL